MCLFNQSPYFTIDHLCCLLRIGFGEIRLTLLTIKTDLANFFVHTKTYNLRIGTVGDFLQIVLCSCSDAIEEQLFSNTASQCHAHTVE
uniref:Uncharacterized protein n=1 Tax=Haematobia irritans TaxID=7368 RepID=A0A1L8E6Z5_HAEIR